MRPADPLLTLRRAARRRAALNVLLIVLPAVAGVAALASVWGAAAAVVTAMLALLVAVSAAVRRRHRFDDAWLAHALNAARPDLEDSADLLLPSAWSRTGLQQLQRARMLHRLHQGPLPDLRDAVAWRSFALSVAAMCLAMALAAWRPWSDIRVRLQGMGAERPAQSAAQSPDVRVDISPPAYTGLRDSRERSLDIKVPEGSHLRWHLRLGPQTNAAALVFHDGERLALQREGGDWTGERRIVASSLLGIAAPDAEGVDARQYRIDVIPDRAPEITVRAPDKTLNLLADDQQQWQLTFDARDDYGLGKAELSIALAQGDGEQVKVSSQLRELRGEGGKRERRYQATLDLAELGFARGDDLIVRLQVADNREPQPNVARSSSFILRWPPEPSSESAGLDSMAQQVMPAYFRSQRQIIIDTEALLSERDDVPEARLLQRADAIAQDQKLLRLRYGQFLGEESEGGSHEEHEHAAGPASRASAESQAMSEFGHVHDIAEAATLLDDATKTVLRSALDAMWQAEGQLRMAALRESLPHEYKALEAIKQVQQSTRIYLARVGQDLPPVDAERRLTGDRAALTDHEGASSASTAAPSPVAATWRALQAGATPDIASLQAWLRGQADVPDALGLQREAERVRRDPLCDECRDALKARLWPLLPPPATAVQPRAAPDAEAAAYMEALNGVAP